MDENDEPRDPEEQAAKSSQLWELSHGHRREDWPDPLRDPYEPTQDELDLLYSHVPGHCWDGWRRLTGDENYFAACSCGWRSTDTAYVSPMLHQVQEHLDEVRAIRGWPRSSRAPARDEGERGASQREMRPDERAAELCASVERQQERLAWTAGQFKDTLAANQEQADRRVAVFEREAETVAQDREQAPASAQRAEALQRRLERAKELRDGIASAAAAVAVAAEEITWVQDLQARHPGSSRRHRRRAGQASESSGAARQTERSSSY